MTGIWIFGSDCEAATEGAHLDLVLALESSEHRGGARRRYRVYVERMRELDVEAAPFPTLPANGSPSTAPAAR